MELQYLGIKLSSHGNVKKAVRQQVDKAKWAAGSDWRNKYLSRIKTRIYKIVIKTDNDVYCRNENRSKQNKKAIGDCKDRTRNKEIRVRYRIEEYKAVDQKQENRMEPR